VFHLKSQLIRWLFCYLHRANAIIIAPLIQVLLFKPKMKNLETDVLLVGGGIMSATLGVLLHQLAPSLNITMVEQLPDVAMESSDALNNAGTGHAGYCELNYTPQSTDGNIAIAKTLPSCRHGCHW
jgi:hypothetical protein